MLPTILFVTRRECPEVTLSKITVETAKHIVHDLYGNNPLAYDIESTGKDPYLSKLLLEAYWDGVSDHPVIVLDSYTVSSAEIFEGTYGYRTILAHNASFEKKWSLVHGMTGGYFICTMTNEQTILSGASDIGYDIVTCLRRRQIEIPVDMDKETRDDFIGANPETFIILDKHIKYNVSDILKLHELYAKQRVHINNLNISFLIHLRSQLITILAEGELLGFVHDRDLWFDILQRRETQAKELVEKLNNYLINRGFNLLDLNPTLNEIYTKRTSRIERLQARFIKLTDQIVNYEMRNKTHLKAYEICVESVAKVGREMSDAQAPLPPPTINWGSPQQPLGVMKALNIRPLPMSRDKKTYQLKEGVGKEARNNWFAENEQHEHMEFMKLFDEFKKIEHNIKSFGREWVEKYYNPVTGKVHTIFRQAGTRTGRFASGDADDGYFNLQQIPKETTEQPDGTELAEYRACFRTTPGRKIATLDYTGCELVCMISLSGDLALKRVSELPDQHSYLGTKCWRNVFTYKYKQTGDPKYKELSETYTMGKGKARDKFKQSGAFPVVYGVKPGKVASIQGFGTPEAQIFIDTIEGEMPNVISFVKSKAAFALANGYVIHNTRTNSRRWFKDVIDAREREVELPRKIAQKVESAARNSPIQGTNVDIIIEAIVAIYRWARLYKVPIRFLGQVHDELIYDFPEDMDWIPDKLKTLMSKTAQRYLIPEIHMHADCSVGYHWIK